MLVELPNAETSGDEAMAAFAAALNSIENVAKTQTADTGKYSYTYADLGDILDECKRVCQMHDLSIFQECSHDGERMEVHTTLIHKSGCSLVFRPMGMRFPPDAQALGSALTYGRRYSLMTIFGIAPEDDDGKAATTAAQTQPGRRTEAERMIREQIGKMTAEQRASFTEQFKFNFGVGLTDLPANKHGDALTWAKEWERQQLDPDIDPADEALEPA